MTRTYSRRVAFAETDASGRVHFTALLRWVEEAEHQWLGEQGVPVLSQEGGWPRVRIECDYRKPFVFGEEALVELQPPELGQRSLRWSFRILSAEQEVAASGQMVTVWTGAEMPSEVRSRLAGRTPS
ncbi:acyl-CoA thioesterase [Roseibacillus ishigakijimensis]|uniref:Acyl-CoA thioesterase n=1 Tax=Roseibacillus ishigakijimensis TaxID=454146 RepID=A0A934VNK2_9BACT|nr:acyl-CoA thioesterase [Roseibacillus ishigakijimensis]MBK1835397.1 acyl-CoA thioesterase [Roseibacillus ishigakijimensis]